ncbi:MAG: site-specific integrase [Clostridia bacterium]|nr:site-specific integrase [Clostridia bacterium]
MAHYKTTVYVGTYDGVKRRKCVSATSKRELSRKVREVKTEVAAGKDCYSNATFHVWAEKWLEEVVAPKGLSTGAEVKYRSAVKHLEREFGNRKLRDIRLSDFQRFINRLAVENPNTGKPMAKATLQNIRKVAANIFDYARRNDIAGVPDYFKGVEVPVSAPVCRRRALSEGEVAAVLETDHRARPMAMCMLFAGLRLGETLPLRWEDIDFDAKVIRITRTVYLQNNTPILKEGGKTDAAVRWVPLPPVLEEALREHRKTCPPDCPYLFTQMRGEGQLMSKSSFRRMWQSYLKALNADREKELHFTAHNLRHTYATFLYLQNVDMREAMQCMGHSSIQVTMDVYTDLTHYYKFGLPDTLREKMEGEWRIFQYRDSPATDERQLTFGDFL